MGDSRAESRNNERNASVDAAGRELVTGLRIYGLTQAGEVVEEAYMIKLGFPAMRRWCYILEGIILTLDLTYPFHGSIHLLDGINPSTTADLAPVFCRKKDI